MQMYKLQITICKLPEALFGTTSTSGTSACKCCTETAMSYQYITHEAVRIKLHLTLR